MSQPDDSSKRSIFSSLSLILDRSMQEFRRGLYDSDATNRQIADVSQKLDELSTIVKALEARTQDQQAALDTARRLERMEQSLERLSLILDPQNQEQRSHVEEQKAKLHQIITFFVSAVAGGIIGNRADEAFMTVVESLQQKPIPATLQPKQVTPKPKQVPEPPQPTQPRRSSNKPSAKVERGSRNIDELNYGELVIAEGPIRFSDGDYNGALACFDRAIVLEPDKAYGYSQRGSAKYVLKDYAGALADFEQALQKTSLGAKDGHSHAFLYYCKGVARYEMHDYRDAIADFDEVIHIVTKITRTTKRNYDTEMVAAAHFERGNAKEKIGELLGAAADRAEALRLGRNPKRLFIWPAAG